MRTQSYQQVLQEKKKVPQSAHLHKKQPTLKDKKSTREKY